MLTGRKIICSFESDVVQKQKNDLYAHNVRNFIKESVANHTYPVSNQRFLYLLDDGKINYFLRAGNRSLRRSMQRIDAESTAENIVQVIKR